MSDAAFPYLAVPREARWREVMAGCSPQQIDPHFQSRLRISRSDRVASAGSCFAQRISHALQTSGYHYLCTERGSPFLGEQERREAGYGLYSARYGNIYTALQLLQLLHRAYGSFNPSEPLWQLPSGSFVDPYRPSVQAGGFASEAECLWDRQAHLAAVRQVFEQADVFIFTLGLTETWCTLSDGAALPVCPGSAAGGQFDPARYQFCNFGVDEVSAHLDAFIGELQAVNPKAQILLTVSPVPLMATMEPRHVLQATVYSKSVLRVVAERAVRQYAHVHYFASYEIVNSSGDSRAFFQDDLRTVSDAAVAQVIACFHRQFTSTEDEILGSVVPAPLNPVSAIGPAPVCDENLVMDALAAQHHQEPSV
jgi:hypothetical protein